jgi:hypothetical protein
VVFLLVATTAEDRLSDGSSAACAIAWRFAAKPEQTVRGAGGHGSSELPGMGSLDCPREVLCVFFCLLV